MKIIHDIKNNHIEIQDDMKSLLRAQRIVVTVVLVASFTKLYFINWQDITTYDYLFVVIFGLFVYFFVKNFFIKTSKSIISLSEIKYLKKAKGVRSKAYLKLKGGKIREFSNITSRDEKIDIPEKFRKAGVIIKV